MNPITPMVTGMMEIIDNLAFSMIILVKAPADGRLPMATIRHVNAAAAELLGYCDEELAGQPLDTILSQPEDARLAHKYLENGDTSPFEVQILPKNQKKNPAILTLSRLPDPECWVLLLQPIKPDSYLFRMRQVVEQTASAIMVTDRSGKIVYANPQFTELTGYSAEELIGQNPKLLHSGKMTQEDYADMWSVLISTGQWRGEIQNKHKNGEFYWVFESISAIKNSRGEITHFVAVEENISGRKQTEGALLESEERFRQMAEMTGEWLWEQDPRGYFLYSSSAVKQILGYGAQEIIGRHYAEFLTEEDRRNQKEFADSRQSYFALVNHYQHKNGKAVLTESTGTPIIDDQGRLVKWRGVDRDITARVHFQEALIESEKRKRLIIESSINAIVIMDSYGIITDWNHRAEEMFGWQAIEAIGKRLDELIIPERFRAAHRKGMDTFLHTGKSLLLNKQTEQVALRRDGREFPVEVSLAPLKLGNTYIFSGFIHDISGRKAAEETIRQAHVNLAIAQNEIKIAQQIQASLSPAEFLESQAFEVTGACLTADKAGGDYYDYFIRSENMLDMVIADVSGHSIGPALFMVETRSAIRAQTHIPATPSRILEVLNNFLFSDLDRSDYFITLFYLQADIANRQLRFANAGHPRPLHLSGKTGEITELDAEGLILGVKKDVAFQENTIPMVSGDIILLYTDGLTEAENPEHEFFGLDRVKTLFRHHAHKSPQDIIDALMIDLQQFCRKTVFADDITLIVFKCR
jgi:phosphoserine phosphatase RsbU/P